MTQLSPLEEVLFQSWTRSQGIENHDDPKNMFDHRGLYKQSNGQILPRGFINSLSQQHNLAMEPQEGGDTTIPDPYMAQAEMHKANLDHSSKQRADQIKVQLEQSKMQHKTSENALDRDHDLKKHLMAQQAKQQQAQAQMQQRQQMAQEQLQVKQQMGQQQMDQKAQMGQQQFQQKAQLQGQQLDHQSAQADQDRQFQASQPEPQQNTQPAPQATTGQAGSGLEQQLMQRQGL